ncbi:hypothetical protein [Sphingomicrobium flavum]|uniref:hypothetical protein n=1 Tax=Sphingomicrobium flavum TaxID=1229164 RepID=UPI0021ADA770|nr:hypothetical protein [Sphingomicrobium flavum]
MKRFLLVALAAGLGAGPAHATGEIICETASGPQTRISLGFGHNVVATGMWAQLQADGEWTTMDVAQSWMDGERLLVDLTNAAHDRLIARIDARWNNATNSFDGVLIQGDTKRWVRCRG